MATAYKTQKDILKAAFSNKPRASLMTERELLHYQQKSLGNSIIKSNKVQELLKKREDTMAKMERNRLKKMQKYLNQGELTMIGDGIYEKNNCGSCNEQHRVGSVKPESRKCSGRKCACPSVLSKGSSTASSIDSLPPINSSIQEQQPKFPSKYLEMDHCDRELYHKLLNQEEVALTERLKYEKKLLEESEKKLKNIELEEAKYALSEHKKLEQEKKKYESVTKRRMTLEAMLKTLDEIPVSNAKEQRSNDSETYGILRYNYSTASRKTVRINDSVEETGSELGSTHTSGTSTISKYLTFASSHYSTDSSESSDDEISNPDLSTQSILEKRKSSEQESSLDLENPASKQSRPNSSYEKRLKPKKEFLQVGQEDKLTEEESVSNRELATVVSEKDSYIEKRKLHDRKTSLSSPGPIDIPTIVITSPSSDKEDSSRFEDTSKSISDDNNFEDSSKSISDDNNFEDSSKSISDGNNLQFEDTSKSISDDNNLQFEDTSKSISDDNNLQFEDTSKTMVETSSPNNFQFGDKSKAIVEKALVRASIQYEQGISILEPSIALTTSNTTPSDNEETLSVTVSPLPVPTPPVIDSDHEIYPEESCKSEGTIHARYLVCQAIETVLQEFKDSPLMFESLVPPNTPCSSEEQLNEAAKAMVRLAIEKVQSELERQGSFTSRSQSSTSRSRSSVLARLVSAKSIRKMFSFGKGNQ